MEANNRMVVFGRVFVGLGAALLLGTGGGCGQSHREPQRPKEPPAIRSAGPSHQEPASPAGNAETDKPGSGDQKPQSPAAEVQWTHQVALETEYYKTGPQQMRPPDGKFAPGTKVRIVREAGSYVQVESETGVTAYVEAGSLKPLP